MISEILHFEDFVKKKLLFNFSKIYWKYLNASKCLICLMISSGTEGFNDQDFLLSFIHVFIDLAYSDNFTENDPTDPVNYQLSTFVLNILYTHVF